MKNTKCNSRKFSSSSFFFNDVCFSVFAASRSPAEEDCHQASCFVRIVLLNKQFDPVLTSLLILNDLFHTLKA